MAGRWLQKWQFQLQLALNRNRGMHALVRRLQQAVGDAGTAIPTTSMSMDKIREILHQTAMYNRNNITRTQAYHKFFQQHPEIHWSLLAHAVSRNGGYEMTDLKGEWFQRVCAEGDDKAFFAVLERANYLIFQDAFVQLLVYAESRRCGRPLFDVLPQLSVSRFMKAIWEWFWETGDSYVLTLGLIVNEQNFIESRVVQNERYGDKVFKSIAFQAQSLLNLTNVILPYQIGDATRLAGTSVSHFTSLADRIETGKRLYDMLYQGQGQEQRHERAQQGTVQRKMWEWLEKTPHTGSRADFWPMFFSPRPDSATSSSYRPRFIEPTDSSRRIYSPRLLDAWDDVEHAAVEPGDWFETIEQAKPLLYKVDRQDTDFTNQYLETNRTIERILLAKETLGIGRK